MVTLLQIRAVHAARLLKSQAQPSTVFISDNAFALNDWDVSANIGGDGSYNFQAIPTLILIFALRCLVPLLLTLLIGWAMNRLVDKWENEEVRTKRGQQSLQSSSFIR